MNAIQPSLAPIGGDRDWPTPQRPSDALLDDQERLDRFRGEAIRHQVAIRCLMAKVTFNDNEAVFAMRQALDDALDAEFRAFDEAEKMLVRNEERMGES